LLRPVLAPTMRALSRRTYIATLVVLSFLDINMELTIRCFVLVQFLSMFLGFTTAVLFAFMLGHDPSPYVQRLVMNLSILDCNMQAGV
jgi:Na+/citrate or Na+/malate symporter